jgi:serine/threonine protein kinase
MRQAVYIATIGEEIYFDVFRPFFESKEINEIQELNYSKLRFHNSTYLVGNYKGKPVGVLFGNDKRIYKSEEEGLNRLKHQGIPECFETGEINTPRISCGYMIIEHMPGIPINKAIDFSNKSGREKAIELFIGLVNVIDYIHANGVVHQDIMADHVLAYEGRVGVIDFGLWNTTDKVNPAYDFCGQSVVIHAKIGDARTNEEKGYNTLLQDITERVPENKFVEGLKDLSSVLSGWPHQGFGEPKTREVISSTIKKKLEDLANL